MTLDDLPPVREVQQPSPQRLSEMAEAGSPAVLRGLVRQWPAVARGQRSPADLNAYLKGMDVGVPGPVMEAPASSAGRFGYSQDVREFSFTKRQRPVPETLDRIERVLGQPNGPILAIQMLPLGNVLPGFVRDNAMPLLPGVEPLLWLGGPVRTQIHNDRDHNLACVVAGRRRFLLFPPDQVANLYIGPADNPPPLSLVDPEAPDLDRFPRFREAIGTAQVAELRAGDALLLPRHWWHHVTSRDPFNAMVNYWWGRRERGFENPQDAFLAALLAFKPLPEAERAYWRAMFDTHVFAGDDAGVAHLPPDARGHLGTLRASARAALKQQLRAIFNRSF